MGRIHQVIGVSLLFGVIALATHQEGSDSTSPRPGTQGLISRVAEIEKLLGIEPKSTEGKGLLKRVDDLDEKIAHLWQRKKLIERIEDLEFNTGLKAEQDATIAVRVRTLEGKIVLQIGSEVPIAQRVALLEKELQKQLKASLSKLSSEKGLIGRVEEINRKISKMKNLGRIKSQ